MGVIDAPTEDTEWLQTVFNAASCRGCGSWTLNRSRLFGTGEERSESYPSRTRRPSPDWLTQLENSRPALAALLDEVYLAANGGQSRLMSMGVRAALDMVMVEIVGDQGGFEPSLSGWSISVTFRKRNGAFSPP